MVLSVGMQDLVPGSQGLNLGPLPWEQHGVLATGSPGTSPREFNFKYIKLHMPTGYPSLEISSEELNIWVEAINSEFIR